MVGCSVLKTVEGSAGQLDHCLVEKKAQHLVCLTVWKMAALLG